MAYSVRKTLVSLHTKVGSSVGQQLITKVLKSTQWMQEVIYTVRLARHEAQSYQSTFGCGSPLTVFLKKKLN